jgi:hypothetical protein
VFREEATAADGTSSVTPEPAIGALKIELHRIN